MYCVDDGSEGRFVQIRWRSPHAYTHAPASTCTCMYVRICFLCPIRAAGSVYTDPRPCRMCYVTVCLNSSALLLLETFLVRAPQPFVSKRPKTNRSVRKWPNFDIFAPVKQIMETEDNRKNDQDINISMFSSFLLDSTPSSTVWTLQSHVMKYIRCSNADNRPNLIKIPPKWAVST